MVAQAASPEECKLNFPPYSIGPADKLVGSKSLRTRIPYTNWEAWRERGLVVGARFISNSLHFLSPFVYNVMWLGQ
jgi:hypothetical protein